MLVFLGRIDSHLHDLAHTEVLFNKPCPANHGDVSIFPNLCFRQINSPQYIYFSLCTTCFGTQPWSRAAFNWNDWQIFLFHFYKSESEIPAKNKLDTRNTKKGKVTNTQLPRKSFLKNIPLRGILTLSPLLSPPPLGHLFSRYWTPFSPG